MSNLRLHDEDTAYIANYRYFGIELLIQEHVESEAGQQELSEQYVQCSSTKSQNTTVETHIRPMMTHNSPALAFSQKITIDTYSVTSKFQQNIYNNNKSSFAQCANVKGSQSSFMAIL